MNKENYFFVSSNIILLILICCHHTCLQAQNPLQDVIYLNDGSILRGKITEQHTDSLIKVRIEGGSIFALHPSDIDSIKEEKPFKSNRNSLPGYFNQTGFSIFMYGSENFFYYIDPVYASFYSVNGYRFPNRIMTGGGVAIDMHKYLMLQFFTDVRWEALNESATPFAYVQGGYGLPLLTGGFGAVKQTYGGLMWSAGTGMRFYFRRQGSLVFSIGYKQTNMSQIIENPFGGGEQKNHYTFNRLALNFGLGF